MLIKRERSIVQVNNVYAEYLFEWFNWAVNEPCGDGAGAIVCKNYVEVADWWLEQNPHMQNSLVHNIHRKYVDEKSVHFHDNNENFIFTNDPEIKLFYGDCIFIVVGDCPFIKHGRVIQSL